MAILLAVLEVLVRAILPGLAEAWRPRVEEGARPGALEDEMRDRLQAEGWE